MRFMCILLTLVLYLLTTSASIHGTCHDVAVVGAGIGGTYAVWRLRNHGLNVGLYEYSDRLGGRLYTQTFPQAPDVPVELGAMRFNKKQYEMLYRTLLKVGLQTTPFLNHLRDDVWYFMRGRLIRKQDFKDDNIPYSLLPHERYGLDNIYRHVIKHTNFSGNISSLPQELSYLVSDDGVKLEHQTRRHSLRLNHQLKGINRTRNIYNLEFTRTQKIDGDTKQTNQTVLVCSRKVILAVPAPALLKINWDVLQSLHVWHSLENVEYYYAVKLFLVYDYMWWSDVQGKSSESCSKLNAYDHRHTCPTAIIDNQNSCPHQTFQTTCCSCGVSPTRDRPIIINSDLPLDRTANFGVSQVTGASVLMVAYSSHGLWRELQKHGKPMWTHHRGISTEVVRHAHIYLAKLYKVDLNIIPDPIDGAMSAWNEFPYDKAFSAWKIGAHWDRVWDSLHKPSGLEDIFISSGSFWNYDSDIWSDNALNSIDKIMRLYF